MSGFIVFCSFLSGHCLSKQERGTWPQEILWKLCWWSTNMSASSEELCQLGFAMMYSWLHQTYSLNQVASNHQYRNQPLLKVFFLSSAAMAMSFYATFLARGIVSIGTFKWLLPSLSSAFPTRPHLRSYTLHSTCDKKISRDNFTNFKTINKKHKMYACLLLDFKALSIVIDFVVRLLGKV